MKNRRLELAPEVELINDFVANGYGCLCLEPADVCTIQEGTPVQGATKALIGAGTGLGVGILTASASGEYQLAELADQDLKKHHFVVFQVSKVVLVPNQ